MKKDLFLVLLFLSVSVAAGLVAEEAHEPENAAKDSDVVVHGTVRSVEGSGEVAGHHPVELFLIDVFKGDRSRFMGNNLSANLQVQVKGTRRTDVSTSADFTEGEEAVLMLQERNETFYMTHGHASKYEVDNGTIRLETPERRNITVEEMESIVRNSSDSSAEVQDRNVEKSDSIFDVGQLVELVSEVLSPVF